LEDLWGEQRPDTAAKALQGYVSQVRKAIGPETLVTRPGGYVLKLAPEALDAHRFEQLVDDARDAEPRDAAAMLRDALALWRGPPLADFTYRSAIHALACRTLGIRHLRTRPRRPQTNGKADWFIRTMLGG
jgi:DNA-binding SARP family transcriptional activator